MTADDPVLTAWEGTWSKLSNSWTHPMRQPRFLECLYTYRLDPINQVEPSTAPPLPGPEDDDDLMPPSTHSYRLRSSTNSLPASAISSRDSLQPSAGSGSSARIGAINIPSPQRNISTDSAKVVSNLLSHARTSTITLRKDDEMLQQLHYQMFDLVNLDKEISSPFMEMWTAHQRHQNFSIGISSPRPYESGQQQLFDHYTTSVRTLLTSLPFANEKGREVLDRLNPAHAAAKHTTCPSDEACYVFILSRAIVAYLLEVKRLLVATEGVFNAILALTGNRHDASRSYSVKEGEILWGRRPASTSVTEFETACKVLEQGYAQLHINEARRVVISTWDRMLVLQLDEQFKMSVSLPVHREDADLNQLDGSYRKILEGGYEWVPSTPSSLDNPPVPTFLSTLIALSLCPKIDPPEGGYLAFTKQARVVNPLGGVNPGQLTSTLGATQFGHQPGGSGSAGSAGPAADTSHRVPPPGKSNSQALFDQGASDSLDARESKRPRNGIPILEHLTLQHDSGDSEAHTISLENTLAAKARVTAVRLPSCAIQVELSGAVFESAEPDMGNLGSWRIRNSSPSSANMVEEPWFCLGSGQELNIGHGRLWSTVAMDTWGHSFRGNGVTDAVNPGAIARSQIDDDRSDVGEHDHDHDVDVPILDRSFDTASSKSVTTPSQFPFKLAAKFSLPDLAVKDDIGSYDPAEALQSIHNEVAVCQEIRMRGLAVNVPVIYGLYRARMCLDEDGTTLRPFDPDNEEHSEQRIIKLYAMLLQRLGPDLCHAPTAYQCGSVIAQYKALHGARIQHVDPSLRHILTETLPSTAFSDPFEWNAHVSKTSSFRPFGSRLYLVDFEAAKLNANDAELEMERREIMRLLGGDAL
ncbi:hypothetical protein BD324DRAFT_658393 [Kockovaella imperatae]|uniref:Uncharacterized protein n=1 Tax=Kockovaella imperatae TaxID=4999 RepID=A0A1Y1U5T3_9TREE|nr:hypothetical protein BD324DRAFT_658393 [Kockovaella imperatae]ORX33352.1 hypothetical protein BD324DRAFT_658393 [Kockovaella imperatae]